MDVSIGSLFSSNRTSQIYLSRRVETESGAFAGVAFAIIDPSVIETKFDEFLDIDIDIISLIDKDSKVLIHWDKAKKTNTENIGKKLQTIEAFRDIPKEMIEKGGLKVGESTSHILSSCQLAALPFHILIAYDKQLIHEDWWAQTRQSVILISVSVGVAIITFVYNFFQIRKRLFIKQQLDEHQIHLEELIQRRTVKLKNVNQMLEKEISERLKAEETIRSSLEEKEMLLREIHHRVKNNLAIVSSLLSMQSTKSGDPALKKIIAESQNRIETMLLIHQSLYQSEELGAINLRNYLTNLIQSIRQSYLDPNSEMEIEVEIVEQKMDIKMGFRIGAHHQRIDFQRFQICFSESGPGRNCRAFFQ